MGITASADKEAPPRGGVVALGNFDGVHRGHAYLIGRARDLADNLGAPLHVVTFEPHPRAFFHPAQPPFRLTPPPVKAGLLAALGVDAVITLPFDAALAAMSAQDFAQQVLVERLAARHIVAGQDFAFGHDRGGDMAKLNAWLAPQGIAVSGIDPLPDERGVPISSTAIRRALCDGDPHAATGLLGRAWSIGGTVRRGAQRGRTLGFPTANIGLGDYLRPRFGVYAVQAGPVDGPLSCHGVANLGVRPTVDGMTETLEAHLFDFDQDIYDQDWRFALTHFIRPERKFDGLDALRAQIGQDVASVRALIA